ncbi:hypothetical protein K2X14_14405 [Acetobacter sp. TBRC 12305]|uniref:Uncharacterized protein n=1 Tax=Acetobacter garciniae TaxID=2817435 RepID=A0A939HND8_9PROT|nr:hypothetical protein [Acetobacter garciniae]MBO1326235.1 hypothetical protein [Acetobacter garciniae]MBX0346027.1 hypothetical protein [Acetobacter garciniae]
MVELIGAEIVDLMMPLIVLERQAERLDSQEEYEAFRERHASENSRVLARVRQAGFIRDDATLQDMQEVFDAAMRNLAARGTASDCAVGKAILNEAWLGLRGWSR